MIGCESLAGLLNLLVCEISISFASRSCPIRCSTNRPKLATSFRCHSVQDFRGLATPRWRPETAPRTPPVCHSSTKSPPMDSRDILNEAVFEDIIKASRAAMKEDLQLAADLERLVASREWIAYLNQVIGRRIQDIGELILQPSVSQDGMVKTEFLKGAMYGLCLARDLPSVIIRSMREASKPQEN